MILDGQNYLSDIANGDAPTALADNASAYVLDQQVKNGIFSEGGAAHDPLFLKAVVTTAFTTGTSATIQVVLQDSADNSSWADVVVGASFTAAQAAIGVDLAGFRLPFKNATLRRYLRLVYRIAVGTMTAGKIVAFLTPDHDVHDLSQRQSTGTIAAPTGAQDESVSNGVLAS